MLDASEHPDDSHERLPRSVQDEELIALVVNGETAAVGDLYDRHAAALIAVALRVLRARSDAEDVVHDVFVSLPERAKGYSPARGSVLAWLVIVVRNLAIDRVRRQGRRSEIEQTTIAHELPPETPNPEVDLETRMRWQAIRGALAALPAQSRETLEIAFFEGLSYPEIAARDGVPLGTVKSRAARALTALAQALTKTDRADYE